jgi:aspartokinase
MIVNKSVVLDELTKLHDGTAVTTSQGGQISGVDTVWDTMNGFSSGKVVVDVSAITITTDQLYRLIMQGSSDEDFGTTANIYDLVEFRLGAGEVLFNGTAGNDVGAAGQRLIFYYSNQPLYTTYRYLRVYFDVSGTGESISAKVHLSN